MHVDRSRANGAERSHHIDAALVKFGFPVGPIQLLDEVGIDTGTKIMPVLEAAYGERFSAPANVVSSILNDDRKGRKNGRRFDLDGQKGRKSKKMVRKGVKAKNRSIPPFTRSLAHKGRGDSPHRRLLNGV